MRVYLCVCPCVCVPVCMCMLMCVNVLVCACMYVCHCVCARIHTLELSDTTLGLHIHNLAWVSRYCRYLLLVYVCMCLCIEVYFEHFIQIHQQIAYVCLGIVKDATLLTQGWSHDAWR